MTPYTIRAQGQSRGIPEDEAAWRLYRRIRAREGLAIDHIDGDPTNNELNNIRVVDVREHWRRD